MSVSKPFVFALVCEALGPDAVRERLGVNATGLRFNSLEAVERSGDERTNPMVNSGAIATTSLVPGTSADARWRTIHEGLSRFAGHPLHERRGLRFRVCDQLPESEHRQPAPEPRKDLRSIPRRRPTSIPASARSTSCQGSRRHGRDTGGRGSESAYR